MPGARGGASRPWLVGILALGLLAGVAGVWLGSRGDDTRAPARTPTWTEGARQRYAIEIDSRVGLVLPSESGPAIEHMEQRLTAALHLRVFGRESGGIRVGFQLDALDYRLAGQRNPGMESGLVIPFAVLFAPNGRPASLDFPEGLERAPRSLLEELVRTFQLVQASDATGNADARSWTSSEENGMGRYLAYYERRPDGVVRKRKTQYTRVALPPDFAVAEVPEIDVRRSDASYRLAEGVAWVERAELVEQAVFTAGARRAGDVEVSARLTLESTDPQVTLALDAPGGWQDMLLAASEALRGGDATALAEGPDLEDWLDALDGPTGDRVRARSKLEDALVARPGLAPELAEAVRGDSSADVAASLIHALERAGTEEAQSALVGLMEDEGLERRRRLQSIIALGGVEDAGDDALHALLRMSYARDQEDLASTALLAAGAAGHSLRSGGSARAPGLGEALHGSLRDAHDEQAVGVALKAMGNMADPDFAESVAPYVDHESAYVRASAVWALERTGERDQSQRLVDRLAHEENGPVRAALVSALDEFDAAPPEALVIVAEGLLDEPNPEVRYAMVEYLGNHLEGQPESRETLAFVALEDTSGPVRRLAATVLMGGDDD